MITDDRERVDGAPPRDFSATPPPGFLESEGRSFVLVGADRVARLFVASLT
jgi:hypothetical protein